MEDVAEELRNLTEVEVELRHAMAGEHRPAQLHRFYTLLQEVRKCIYEITDEDGSTKG